MRKFLNKQMKVRINKYQRKKLPREYIATKLL
jgi:hypothetical protein